MADKTTLAQMLEHLVNDDQQKAEELFHEYVVAASREIYEGLIESEIEDDEEVDEAAHNDDEEDDKVDEASGDDDEDDVEESFDDFAAEADDEGGDMGGDPTDDLESDLDADMDDAGDDKEPGELFQDLNDIVSELQAQFDAMGDDGDMGDMGDSDMGDGDMGDDSEVKDSFDDELATVREYVEKIGSPKMGDNGTNNKSLVAGKNDMGGTTANIAKNFSTEKGGTQGGLANPSTKEENGGNVNVPGGNAGKTAFKKKEPGHGAEKKATGDNGDKSAQSLFRGRR